MEELQLEWRTWERDWTWEGLPVLHGRCTLPQFPGESAPARRMERYWRHWERCFLGWMGRYHGPCCARAAEALRRSRPIPMDTVTVETRELYRGSGLLSLLVTRTTPQGVRGFPELWRLGDGTPAEGGGLVPLWRRLGRRTVLTGAGLCLLEGAEVGRLLVPLEKIRTKLERLAR